MADKDIQIKISSVAELRGLRAAEAALQDQISTAKATGESYSTLEKELAGVQDRFANISRLEKFKLELFDLADRTPVLDSVMRGLNGSFGKAVVAATALGAVFLIVSSAASSAVSALKPSPSNSRPISAPPMRLRRAYASWRGLPPPPPLISRASPRKTTSSNRSPPQTPSPASSAASPPCTPTRATYSARPPPLWRPARAPTTHLSPLS